MQVCTLAEKRSLHGAVLLHALMRPSNSNAEVTNITALCSKPYTLNTLYAFAGVTVVNEPEISPNHFIVEAGR